MVEADNPGSLTIEDVARLAGVSSARDYFSRPQLLSAPTHARIKAAVAQTGAGARVPVLAADVQHLGPLEQPGVEGSHRRGHRRQQPRLMRLPRREPRSR